MGLRPNGPVQADTQGGADVRSHSSQSLWSLAVAPDAQYNIRSTPPDPSDRSGYVQPRVLGETTLNRSERPTGLLSGSSFLCRRRPRARDLKRRVVPDSTAA